VWFLPIVVPTDEWRLFINERSHNDPIIRGQAVAMNIINSIRL